MRLYLVDGTVELFRCFHGAPRATNGAGDEVGAGRAVFATMAALVADPEVTHVAVTFDSLLAPAEPDPLGVQVPLAVDVVRALGIVVWPSGRFSADELLASGARRFREQVDRVVLCTSDIDNAQCIQGDRVVLLNRSRRTVTDESEVRARWGVRPDQLADLFALVGDRSDGIAGLAGFGVKSAGALISEFGCIDAVPDDPEAWPSSIRGRTRLAATLRRHRHETMHARDLLTLRDDAPIPYDLEQLVWNGAVEDQVDDVLSRLEAPELRDRIARWTGTTDRPT